MFFLILLLLQEASAQFVTHHLPLFEPALPKPQFLVPTIDPTFGSTITRITNAKDSNRAGIFNNYSRRQAWNCDESLLMLHSGRKLRLYHGQSYQFIREINTDNAIDLFWHPTNPNMLYFMLDTTMYTYDALQNRMSVYYVFDNLKHFPRAGYYKYMNNGAGDISRDFRYYAFHSYVVRLSDGARIFSDVILFDIPQKKVLKQIPVTTLIDTLYGGVTISPLGNYIVVGFINKESKRKAGLKIYDREFRYLWTFPSQVIHFDLGIEPSGEEVCVMEYGDTLDVTTRIKKVRLSDGMETELMQLSGLFNIHVSCRNLLRNDWCFVKCVDGYGVIRFDSASWMPFRDEVFAVKMDGSGAVHRLTHHHGRAYDSSNGRYMTKSNYRSEVHATASRRGDRILFASNWGQNVLSDSALDTYVVDFRNLLTTTERFVSHRSSVILHGNYPNPFSERTSIRFSLFDETVHTNPRRSISQSKYVSLKIFNVLGAEVTTLMDGELPDGDHEVEFNSMVRGMRLRSGLYFYRLIGRGEWKVGVMAKK